MNALEVVNLSPAGQPIARGSLEEYDELENNLWMLTATSLLILGIAWVLV